MGKKIILKDANFATNGIYFEPNGYTWYCTDYTTNKEYGTPNTGAIKSYGYFSTNEFDNCAGHTVNAIKLHISATGTLTVGRISSSDRAAAVLETRSIQVKKTGMQILRFDDLVIGSGETFAIMDTTDTAVFLYSTLSGNGFYAACGKGSSIQNITGTKSICVDVGYYSEV